MERVKWMETRGKKVLYIDYRGLVGLKGEAEANAVWEESQRILKMSPTKVLMMTNFNEAHGSKEFMDRINKEGKETKDKVEKSALLGITGVKSILFSAYVRFTGQNNLKSFDTEEAAIEYLVS
ncbi:MAG: hypothetical protein PHO26_03050 [Dehalococcoidia bacterium]|nr:hypothetical protein [Dehalococcoidia bacterium]MDD5493486.1 hypothetical protein [Dehalococcoidia bacterium]